jgi:hypothetical protein
MEKTDDQNDMHSDFGDDDGLSSRLSAAPKECTDAHMKQMDAMIAKMSDAAKKKEATSALDMSKAEMKKGNMGRLHEVYEAGSRSHGTLIRGLVRPPQGRGSSEETFSH